MTPEQEERIRTLTNLIANEKDHEKVKVLATELESLLSVENKPPPAGQKSSSRE